jgi:KDO2-lipid IV(A) lauroyltransferase
MFLTRKRVASPQSDETRSRHSVAVDIQLRLEALTLHGLWWLSRKLGSKRASDAAAWLMGVLSGPRSRAMQRMRRNLRMALVHENDETIETLTREAVANLARTVVEYPHLRGMAGTDLERFVEFAAEVPEARLSPERKPAIYIGMHQANWEVVPAIASMLGKPLTIVVSPLTNPYVHRLVSKARPDVWSVQVERDNAIRSLIRTLASGNSVGLLADQRFEGGGLVPFFGQGAMTALGPARLAMKTGCDLVPIRIERRGPLRFRITTYAAIRPDDEIDNDRDRAIDMMRSVNRRFETWIREKPGEWMCMKRRWPIAAYECVG